jgi:Protein of unknown function (DUF732)
MSWSRTRRPGPSERVTQVLFTFEADSWTVLRSATLGDGYKICAQIREGMSPDDAINQYMGFSRLWSPTTVYAAQHELCPNTLPPS